MKNVFVSYSHNDIEFARKFVDWLEKNGYKVWVDKKRILPGANYLNSIADGIKKADAFITLLSKDSVSSKWVAREVFYALENDREIIPVLVEFAEIPEGLKLAITGLHYVDFTGNEITDDPWKTLTSALSKKNNSESSLDFPAVSANHKFLHYFKTQTRKKTLWALTVFSTLLLIIGFLMFQLMQKQQVVDPHISNEKITMTMELPKQDGFNVKGVSNEIEATLRIAYSTERKDKAPSAAISVMVQEKEKSSASWRSLHDGESLSSADNYRIIFQPEDIAYFYVFQIDSTGKLDWIYPKNISSPYSSGNNPVYAGNWIQIPGDNEAFHLDENIGIEHIYIVVTKSPWDALEKSLRNASERANEAIPVTTAFNLKTRGVGGTRIVDFSLIKGIKTSSKEITRLMNGKAGVLVVEKWFRHIAPKE